MLHSLEHRRRNVNISVDRDQPCRRINIKHLRNIDSAIVFIRVCDRVLVTEIHPCILCSIHNEHGIPTRCVACNDSVVHRLREDGSARRPSVYKRPLRRRSCGNTLHARICRRRVRCWHLCARQEALPPDVARLRVWPTRSINGTRLAMPIEVVELEHWGRKQHAVVAHRQIHTQWCWPTMPQDGNGAQNRRRSQICRRTHVAPESAHQRITQKKVVAVNQYLRRCTASVKPRAVVHDVAHLENPWWTVRVYRAVSSCVPRETRAYGPCSAIAVVAAGIQAQHFLQLRDVAISILNHCFQALLLNPSHRADQLLTS